MGTAAHIKAQRFPGKWLLEDALAEITCEEKRFAPASGHRCEKPRLGQGDSARSLGGAAGYSPS